MKIKHLLIISDTRIQRVGSAIYAFNSVVKELDVFVMLFEKITWIGYDYSDIDLDPSLMRIDYPQVQTILLKRSGGNKLIDKVKIIISLPYNSFKLIRHSVNADVIHSRGPSVPMLVALILSFIYRRPKWWFKYANNWNDSNSPFFWGLQKKLMIASSHSVGTVNGVWPDMPDHIKAFENPCLTKITELGKVISFKKIRRGWRIIFVGRIEEKKGYQKIFEVLDNIQSYLIESITVIGWGTEQEKLRQLILNHPEGNKVRYLGPQSNKEVFKHLLHSHFLLLPTVSSEGFPKVISEGFSMGCIPITSDTSSIGQYVKHGINGFIWNVKGELSYYEVCKTALSIDEVRYHQMLQSGISVAYLFTYSRYFSRIENDILCY